MGMWLYHSPRSLTLRTLGKCATSGNDRVWLLQPLYTAVVLFHWDFICALTRGMSKPTEGRQCVPTQLFSSHIKCQVD
ncbi:hypothetical protein BDR05DRAFT_970539 [Suillus weaverae]|nr:hypothetical protein BDR05DRAFT_970539 [Suillus weaverae]